LIDPAAASQPANILPPIGERDAPHSGRRKRAAGRYCFAMTSYVCRYPDGVPGVALLLVRVCLGAAAFGVAIVLAAGLPGAQFFHLSAALLALLLVIGLASRSAAVLLALSLAGALAMPGQVQQLLLLAGHIGACMAIVLLGPGAFSIDSMRHGRRVILLKANTPDRGAGD